LTLLWAELASVATLGEVAASRQLGFFVLTAILPPPHPALLPLFLSFTVPFYISLHRDSQVHVNSTALLANLLASSLLASLSHGRSKNFIDVRPSFNTSAVARAFLTEMTRSKSNLGDSLCSQMMLYPGFVQHFGVLA